MAVLLFIAACFLAYSNGANDNFKGVASLFGSRTTSYRTAIAWATAATFAGSICAIFLAQSLMKAFSGKGLVPDRIAGSGHFLLAVALGAGITVIAATFLGFPISTTHALTGAILGSGLMAAGAQVKFQSLGKGFLLPLLLSPVLAVILAALLYSLLRLLTEGLGITRASCVCVAEVRQLTLQLAPAPQPGSTRALAAAPAFEITTGVQAECQERYAGQFIGLEARNVADGLHFLSAGVVSFARGLNDTPKIAAMLLAFKAVDIRLGMGALAMAMAIGGLLNATKVAETMSLKITSIDQEQGLAANLTTGALVILASLYALPVSTTHVSVGALFGIGLTRRNANVNVVLGILLSWVLTLPCAALVGGMVWWLVSR